MNLINQFFKQPASPEIANNDIKPTEENVTFEQTLVETDKGKVNGSGNESTESREIPEHIFVEYENPKSKNMEIVESQKEIHDLSAIYQMLEKNLEKKGYEDALMNPDTNYMEESIQYIQNETTLLISRVKTYYSGYLRTIDFHIETRKRSGMVETVDELLTHKKSIEEEMRTVEAIEKEAKNNTGICQNIILGYKKGFKNGFAAITYNNVLGRKNQ